MLNFTTELTTMCWWTYWWDVILGLVRAGWARLGPDAEACVQAWCGDICEVQEHQLLSAYRRQLYLNIHTKGRLMWTCLAPHDAIKQAKVWKCQKEFLKKGAGNLITCLSRNTGPLGKFWVVRSLIAYTSHSTFWECFENSCPSFLSCGCNVPVQLLPQYHLSLASKRRRSHSQQWRASTAVVRSTLASLEARVRRLFGQIICWRSRMERLNVQRWVFWEQTCIKRADGPYFAVWISGVKQRAHRGRFVGKLSCLLFLCAEMGKSKMVANGQRTMVHP